LIDHQSVGVNCAIPKTDNGRPIEPLKFVGELEIQYFFGSNFETICAMITLAVDFPTLQLMPTTYGLCLMI
jgi:hypothetical protein